MSNTDQHAMFASRLNSIDDVFMAKLRRELAENGTGSLHLLNDDDILRLAVCRSSPSANPVVPHFSVKKPTPRLATYIAPQLSAHSSPLFSAQALLSSERFPLLTRAVELQQQLARAQEYALKITTFFEGAKTMNYQAHAGDFDGQGTSFGLFQWNFGQNTLGPLLKKMLVRDPRAFAGCFGADADYDTLKNALDTNSQVKQLNWARELQKTPEGRRAWAAAFKALGSVEAFNAIQREQAVKQYHPGALKAIKLLRGIKSELMRSIEFRSYAALLDLSVQQGSLHGLSEIKRRVEKEKPATQLEFLEIAVVETAKKATGHVYNKKLRKNESVVSDCISRRMGILTGQAYESTENKVTRKRENPNYDLIIQHGTEQVTGL
jgi:hypothetical protein